MKYDEREIEYRKQLCDKMLKRLEVLKMQRDDPEAYEAYIQENWRKNLYFRDLLLEREIFNNAGGIETPDHINIKDLSNLISRITLDEDVREQALKDYEEAVELENQESVRGGR